MAEGIKTKGIPQKELRAKIEKIKDKVRNDPVFLEVCEKHGVSPDEIDMFPMCFAELDVSARTDHGVIYFSTKLIDDDFSHYMVHEITHCFQQTTGDKPTPGSDEGDYLDNPAEKEGFQNQSEYLSETKGDLAAEKYIDQVLDHHDVNGKEREEKKEELLKTERVTRFDALSKLAREL